MKSQELIDWCRLNRRQGNPDGAISDRVLLIDVLAQLLDEHLERTAPEGLPARTVETPEGYTTIPARPAPLRRPPDTDETAKQLATVIGYLQDDTAG
jgi:hypothetical protein